MRALAIVILLVLGASPVGTAHHVFTSQSARSCDVVEGVYSTCTVRLRQQVELEACDATGCEAGHGCGLELSGIEASAEGLCAQTPWALAVDHGFVSTSRVHSVWIAAGSCHEFIATGSGRAPVQSLGLPSFETGEFQDALRVCVA